MANHSERLRGNVRTRHAPRDEFPHAEREEYVGSRRGLTLIELLVVVSIMMLLVVVAVPRMRPAMENRRIREAARAINVYLSAARSRAIETGRAWGVSIIRDGNMALAGSRLIQVETPPPWAGDFDNSTILVAANGNVSFPQGETPVADGLVKTGDVLRLDFKNHQWQITVNSANNWSFQSQTTANAPDTSSNPNGLRFQILRQPVPSSVAPLQLPRNVTIDLWYSGTASAPLANTATAFNYNPTVMFASTGSVSQVVADPMGVVAAMQPIYLLVGRRDRVNPDQTQGTSGNNPDHTIPAVAEDGLGNLCDATHAGDLNNLWVAINPQTGYIVCAETAADDPTNPELPIVEARRFAREFQSMGGR